MASRYTNNETKKLNDGRNVYRSRIYPEIPLSDNDIYVASETGDRLDTLAYQYYNIILVPSKSKLIPSSAISCD